MANLKDLIVNGVTRFVGKAYAQTPDENSNDTQIATTKFVRKNSMSIDLSNISSEGLNTLLSYTRVCPAYQSIINTSGLSSYTAPGDGLFYMSWIINDTSSAVYVNSIPILVVGDNASGVTYNNVTLLVSKGDTISCNIAWRYGNFIPYKKIR